MKWPPLASEIDFRYSTLIGTTDNLQLFRYTVRNVAQNMAGRDLRETALWRQRSGMHQSLWQGDTIFAGDGYAGLSQAALFYIGGLLKHAAASLPLPPTTNGYKRLVPI
jgi:glutamine synthetase